MKDFIFPKGFLWGAVTASYQVEGGKEYRGCSIWDRFSSIPGNILDGTSGDTACDHYHLYAQDVALMKQLGLQSYRLSVSWPRIFSNGTGEPNTDGIDFYKKLLMLLRENGIRTVLTLYHWDLPQKLQDIGGWVNRETADYFEDYARCLFKELDGLVDMWITHNEPFCTAFLGNWRGVFAPGLRDFSAALQVAHNLMLSHGKAVRAFRDMKTKGEIGITLNMSHYYPENDCDADRRAVELSHRAWNDWFADPIFKKCYPEPALEQYRGKVELPKIVDGDFDIISAPIDFLGLNHYSSMRCSMSENEWPLNVKEDFVGQNHTDMGWGICPEGFYDIVMRVHERYGGIKLYITENGCAVNDIVNIHGKVEDDNRIDYYTLYLEALHRAIMDGADVRGYYAWSLLDNFEWSSGLSKRFGLVYVDYNTLERTIKKSGYWYRDVIRQNGINTIP